MQDPHPNACKGCFKMHRDYEDQAACLVTLGAEIWRQEE